MSRGSGFNVFMVALVASAWFSVAWGYTQAALLLGQYHRCVFTYADSPQFTKLLLGNWTWWCLWGVPLFLACIVVACKRRHRAGVVLACLGLLSLVVLLPASTITKFRMDIAAGRQ